MKQVLLKTKYLMWLPVIGLMTSATATTIIACMNIYKFIEVLIEEGSKSPKLIVSILSTIDIFLIATVQVIVAFGICSLFFGYQFSEKAFSSSNLSELKVVISELIILVLAVKFVEEFFENNTGVNIVWTALAISSVCAVLIAFCFITSKHSSKKEH
jgi:uncharacterized membrane protein YqhA